MAVVNQYHRVQTIMLTQKNTFYQIHVSKTISQEHVLITNLIFVKMIEETNNGSNIENQYFLFS